MTDKIKDYIRKMPSADGDAWQLLKKVSDKFDMDGKFSSPFFVAQNIATFFLVGDDKTETNEETEEKTETFTITHLEFIDWGILPDDNDEDVGELTKEQVAEAVQEMVLELLDLEIGEHEHAYYNSYNGWNLYRAPLKDAVVVVRKGEEVTFGK
jgi:hypothetical protein